MENMWPGGGALGILLLCTGTAYARVGWTEPTLECVWTYDVLFPGGVYGIEQCRILCELQTTFSCLSVDYYLSTHTCYMQNADIKSTPLFVQRPCSLTGMLHSALSLETDLWGEVEYGCLTSFALAPTKYRFQCQQACIDETSFVCRAIVFKQPFYCNLLGQSLRSGNFSWNGLSTCTEAEKSQYIERKRSGSKYQLKSVGQKPDTAALLLSTTVVAKEFCTIKCSSHGFCDSFGYKEGQCDLYGTVVEFLTLSSEPGYELIEASTYA